MGAHRKIRGYFFQFLKTHAGYSTRTPGVSTFNALTPWEGPVNRASDLPGRLDG